MIVYHVQVQQNHKENHPGAELTELSMKLPVEIVQIVEKRELTMEKQPEIYMKEVKSI